ncbi:MAG: glycosyltransferase family 2 protein [Candidatus Omnitrophota bacterium]
MNICVLIPSFNEAKTIAQLVKRVLAQHLVVVVVDDGSADTTAEVAAAAGAAVLKHPHNKGKGAALKNGFRFALNKKYDAVITMDGDDQHSPDDIAHFIQAALTSDADIIVGNRMTASRKMPKVRWLTNKAMSSLVSLICRRKIPDSQCGFRLFKRAVLAEMNPLSDNYEIETEILIEASRKGFKISSIPIQTIYTSKVGSINPVIDTIRFIRYLLRMLFTFNPNK